MIYTIRHTEVLVDEFEIEADSKEEALEKFHADVEDGWITFDRAEMVSVEDKVVYNG